MVLTVEEKEVNNEWGRTPSPPKGLREVTLSENAYQVFKRRYIRRGKGGEPSETIKDTFWRVAYHVARIEEEWGNDALEIASNFYDLLASKHFLPNSPTFTGAGTPLGQLAACFVLPISDDMGRWDEGIFQTLRNAALIQQTGGGNGFSFSRLRPRGTLVSSSSGQATGPVGFLRVYDKAFGEIAQGGIRRGANMAVLRVDHPDIELFIKCKINEDAVTNFNISVGITDAFMEAVENNRTWELRFPDVDSTTYRKFSGTLEEAEEAGIPIKLYKRIRARDLFESIVKQAHHNGEPGVLFIDAANRSNPLPHLYRLEATNPCGEQWLGPYENCCLGSVNLAQYSAPEGRVDWRKLRFTIKSAVRFLDNVVDMNGYVPAVPELRKSALRSRRIGLGIMGLADLMFHVGVRYGSDEASEFSAQVMEFIRFHAMESSIELARYRSPFPSIQGSVYDPDNLSWRPPIPLEDYRFDWERPNLDWEVIVTGIRNHGIRNAAQTTIAPTGTVATIAGCEGYGCEPVFALAYIRHFDDNGTDLKLTYTSPLFEKALIRAGIDETTRRQVFDKVLEEGSCQTISSIPDEIRNVFVVSQDISAEEHVRTQGALQTFVDSGLSKTINFPEGTLREDIAKSYLLAWKLGCKGITVYVTGSRQNVVLETNSNVKNVQVKETQIMHDQVEKLNIWHAAKKPRPRRLRGYTYSITTPLGKTFVTVNENGNNQPFEVFISTAKAGSDTAAVSEAIGRLISYNLRLASPISPRERMDEIIRQLSGIGGRRTLGFGPNQVLSLPDGVAQALLEYIEETAGEFTDSSTDGRETKTEHLNLRNEVNQQSETKKFQIGDLCPECGQAALVNEEGCRKCYSCSYCEC